MDKLLTPKETAEILQVSEKTITRLIMSGKLKASKVGRFWRIKPEDIDLYLKANTFQK